MNKNAAVGLLLGAMMLASAGATVALTPHVHQAQTRPAFLLERVVPASFGGWSEERNMAAVVVNPETALMLKKIYSQTLSRTYVNRAGERVMLSIAYGGDQSDAMQVHYPEVCYPAQGFELLSERKDTLGLAGGAIPVTRLETSLSGRRFEPITYWTTVGDRVVRGGIDKKLAEMKYGLSGEIPDGLLFRVSSINTDSAQAFAGHDAFVDALRLALAPADRKRLMGQAQ